MLCDLCHVGEYMNVGILANVKSHTLTMVQCKLCGYATVKKGATKRA